MPRYPHVFYPRPNQTDLERTREIIRKTIELLGEQPDTFLGRRTQEPFPKEMMRSGATDEIDRGASNADQGLHRRKATGA